MRRVSFDPAALEPEVKAWFDNWLRRADEATDRVCTDADEGSELRFRQGLWAELKNWLLTGVFQGKCAYCEGRMTAQSWGAAEHYRPKGRVTVRNPETGKLEVQTHPGYYWLAHQWRNIVPACDRCNSGEGKQDQFPIRGTRVMSPGELTDAGDLDELNAREEPLLLHPYADEPADHVTFGVAGVIAPRNNSARGRETIEICRLDREALATERQSVQEDAQSAVMLAFQKSYLAELPLQQCLRAVQDKYGGHDAEYSAAGRQAVFDAIDAVLSDLRNIAGER
jgi:hypothetical protein